MKKMRDSIDFKNMDIAALFRKLLLPTVLGMIFSASPTVSLWGKALAVTLLLPSILWLHYGYFLPVSV